MKFKTDTVSSSNDSRFSQVKSTDVINNNWKDMKTSTPSNTPGITAVSNEGVVKKKGNYGDRFKSIL